MAISRQAGAATQAPTHQCLMMACLASSGSVSMYCHAVVHLAAVQGMWSAAGRGTTHVAVVQSLRHVECSRPLPSPSCPPHLGAWHKVSGSKHLALLPAGVPRPARRGAAVPCACCTFGGDLMICACPRLHRLDARRVIASLDRRTGQDRAERGVARQRQPATPIRTSYPSFPARTWQGRGPRTTIRRRMCRHPCARRHDRPGEPGGGWVGGWTA